MRRWPRIRVGSIYGSLALLVTALLVLGPFILVMVNSFQTARPGQAPAFSLATWRIALSDDRILSSLWNTVSLAVVTHGIAMVIAIPIAWLLTRTDLPYVGWLEFLFWISFFLPALPITQGWILLLDPHFGLLNQLTLQIPFIHAPLFNIYSFWGMVWASLAHESIAIKVVLLVPAFLNLDAALEEVSLVSGANTRVTLVRVVIPLLAPIVVVVLLLSFITALRSFERELVLGLPFRFYTFSTLIYQLLQGEPPLYANATVLASIILAMVLPFIVLQRWLIGRKSYVTVSGQFRITRLPLRRWRLPAFLAVLGLALTCTIVPLGLLIMGTFMKLFGFFNLANPWTVSHWTEVLTDPAFVDAFKNTMGMSLAVSLLGVILFALITYVTERTKYRARAGLDIIAWLPSSLPGIILSLGLLWVFVGFAPLRPLYGTVVVLILGVLVSHMTIGVQTIRGTIVQLGMDLEEAARVTGGSWWEAIRRILLPLLAPVLLLVGAMTFVAAAGDVSTVALLSTKNTRPLSMLQLSYVSLGQPETGAVVGVIIVVLTTGVAFAARMAGSRYGLTARRPVFQE